MDFSKFVSAKSVSASTQKSGLSITNTDSGMRIRLSGELAKKIGVSKEDIADKARKLQVLFGEDSIAIGFGIVEDAEGFSLSGKTERPMLYNSALAKEILDYAGKELGHNKTHTFSRVKYEKVGNSNAAIILVK